MTALLEARGVTKAYGAGLLDREAIVALQDFSLTLEIEQPSIIAIVGDQMSDIDGKHSGCRFKVPNPFYFIP